MCDSYNVFRQKHTLKTTFIFPPSSYAIQIRFREIRKRIILNIKWNSDSIDIPLFKISNLLLTYMIERSRSWNFISFISFSFERYNEQYSRSKNTVLQFRSDIFNEEFRDNTRILKIIQGLCATGERGRFNRRRKASCLSLPAERRRRREKKAKARVILTEKLACSASIKASFVAIECNGTTIQQTLDLKHNTSGNIRIFSLRKREEK